MGGRPVKIIGQVFGKWTVLSKDSASPDTHHRWLSRCECGNIVSVRGDALREGKSLCCLKCSHKAKTRPDTALKQLYSRCRSDSEKRGFVFRLTLSEFADIIGKACKYCGKPPELRNLRGRVDNPLIILRNGIDRINNKLGYLPDNVQPCCVDCNFAKRSKTHEEFMSWIRRLIRHNI